MYYCIRKVNFLLYSFFFFLTLTIYFLYNYFFFSDCTYINNAWRFTAVFVKMKINLSSEFFFFFLHNFHFCQPLYDCTVEIQMYAIPFCINLCLKTKHTCKKEVHRTVARVACRNSDFGVGLFGSCSLILVDIKFVCERLFARKLWLWVSSKGQNST